MKRSAVIALLFSLVIGVLCYTYGAHYLHSVLPGLWNKRLTISTLISGIFFLVLITHQIESHPENVMSTSRDKTLAQDHPVPPQYLSYQLKGMVVGSFRRKFVTIPFEASPEHQLMLGSPGSGKSATLLSALLINYNIADISDRCHSILAFDVKPELSYKSVKEDREDIRRINPSIMGSWGFDPFYGLSAECTDDALKSRCSLISQTLISEPADGKGKHFTENARKIMNAALMYGFRLGFSLTESIVHLMDASAEDLIAEILASPDMEEHPKIRNLVKEFEEKTSEGFQDIVMTLQREIDIFEMDTVQYCFSNKNPNRVTPQNLIDGISIFLALPDNLLRQYSPVFRLILALSMNYLTSIKETQKTYQRPIWILVDEAGSIGPIPDIKEVLARGRSRGIQVTLVCQSFAQLESTYGNDGARTILDCCKTTIVLSCNDNKTAQTISAWCGDYRETKTSTTTRYRQSIIKGADSATESKEYRSIVNVADIKNLEGDGKVLVFVKGTWFMVPKLPYFKIRRLRELSTQVSLQNEELHSSHEDEEDHFEES